MNRRGFLKVALSVATSMIVPGLKPLLPKKFIEMDWSVTTIVWDTRGGMILNLKQMKVLCEMVSIAYQKEDPDAVLFTYRLGEAKRTAPPHS